MKYLIILLLFTSCMTQKKVVRYMNEHPEQAENYYREKYPIKDSIVTVVIHDTVARDKAVQSFNPSIDSLMQEAERINQERQAALDQLAAMRRQSDYTEGEVEKLQQLLSKPKIDTAAFRKRIEQELMVRIPIPTNTQTDHYQESQANIDHYKRVDAELASIQVGKKDLLTAFGWFMLALIKKWWFWLIIVALAGWVYWRIRAGALKSVLKKVGLIIILSSGSLLASAQDTILLRGGDTLIIKRYRPPDSVSPLILKGVLPHRRPNRFTEAARKAGELTNLKFKEEIYELTHFNIDWPCLLTIF